MNPLSIRICNDLRNEGAGVGETIFRLAAISYHRKCYTTLFRRMAYEPDSGQILACLDSSSSVYPGGSIEKGHPRKIERPSETRELKLKLFCVGVGQARQVLQS
jgi:hypothetical protein